MPARLRAPLPARHHLDPVAAERHPDRGAAAVPARALVGCSCWPRSRRTWRSRRRSAFPIPLILALYATNCLEALIGAGLVRKLSATPDRFDTLRGEPPCSSCRVVLVAPVVSGFVDAAAVAILRGEPYWSVWRHPVLLEHAHRPRPGAGHRVPRPTLAGAPRGRSLPPAHGGRRAGPAARRRRRRDLRSSPDPGGPAAPRRGAVARPAPAPPPVGGHALRGRGERLRPPVHGPARVPGRHQPRGVRIRRGGRAGGPRPAGLPARGRDPALRPGRAHGGAAVDRAAPSRSASASRPSSRGCRGRSSTCPAAPRTAPSRRSCGRSASTRTSPTCCSSACRPTANGWSSASSWSAAGSPAAWPPSSGSLSELLAHAAGSRGLVGRTTPAAAGRWASPWRPATCCWAAWSSEADRRAVGARPDTRLHLIAEVFSSALERHRAEEDARRSREELAHFLRVSTVGELTTSLAHELNQPLTAILANAQAARQLLEASRIHDEIREILSDIVEEDKRAGEVIRRLRELLRKGAPGVRPSRPQRPGRGGGAAGGQRRHPPQRGHPARPGPGARAS